MVRVLIIFHLDLYVVCVVLFVLKWIENIAVSYSFVFSILTFLTCTRSHFMNIYAAMKCVGDIFYAISSHPLHNILLQFALKHRRDPSPTTLIPPSLRIPAFLPCDGSPLNQAK